MAELVAAACGVSGDQVMTASTGVIGRPMAMDKLAAGIDGIGDSLARGTDVDTAVARAIMTTDLVQKQVAVEVESDSWSGAIKIGGVCKGSGMIAPRMGPPHATMLCFITTNAGMTPGALQTALNSAVNRTFNRITVDGDTSTNDMVLLLANGAGPSVDSGAEDFTEALTRVCRNLAKKVARDGEGATKLAEIVVQGARSEGEAEQIARTIADSPLVKTALYGCDPNWGRILMAAGRAGISFDPGSVEVRIGDTAVFESGTGMDFDAAAVSAYLSKKDVRILVDLHAGDSEATIWTCDFSYDYVRINAEYHT
jgi:glutamate N-acetyltransferase/amino-acid N-acetyltransferase